MRYVFRRFSEAFEILVRPGQYLRLDEQTRRALEKLSAIYNRNGLGLPLNKPPDAVRKVGMELVKFGLSYQWASEDRIQVWENLTPREQEVTAYVCLGYSNREIARRMMVAHSTVKSHLHHVLQKFNARGRVELESLLEDWNFDKWK
jgi:DNA-binding CsgD family transcriptional regulator